MAERRHEPVQIDAVIAARKRVSAPSALLHVHNDNLLSFNAKKPPYLIYYRKLTTSTTCEKLDTISFEWKEL